MKDNLLKKIFKYSLCYLVIVLFIALYFYFSNKSMVWINVSYDGLDQHLVNLHLLKNLLLGNFNFFFWNIGYGMDLFANFTYYIFGDFPSFIGVFFPNDKMHIAYEIIIFLRIYLSGLAFIIYCNDKKYSEKNVIIGSILYAFSCFSLFSMARHPYFLNTMFIFPIFLLSVEKLVLEDKKIFFILMVEILFISSFYFGYMLAIIVMVYAVIIALLKYSDKKIIIKKFLWALLYAMVGVMIAGVFLIPTFEAFLASPRIGGSLYFYPFDYYPKLLASLISTDNTGNWSIIGVSSIILVTLPAFLLDKKRNKSLLFFLIALLIPLIIPLVGTIFDCMSFPNNRWTYVIPFILSLITMEVLDKKLRIDIRKSIIFIISYTIIIFLLRLKISVQEIVAVLISFLFLYLLVKNKKYILPVVVVSIIFNFYFMYDNHFGGYINEFVQKDATILYKNNNNEVPYLDEALEFIKSYDNGFYNILVFPSALNNLGLINNYNSTAYFYSIVSKNYYDLAYELQNQEMTMNKEIKTFNHRTKINELLNNKYLITTNKDYHPYGYEVIKIIDNNTYILENKIGSSFAHLYTKSITLEEYEKLSPLLKEDALLKYYISSNNNDLELTTIHRESYQANKSLKDNSLVINSNKDPLILSFNSIKNRELYLSINNLKYDSGFLIREFGKLDFNINVCLNNLCLNEREDNKYLTPYYIENSHILVNLGYFDDLSGEVKVYFDGNGKYSFDNIELLSVDFEEFKDITSNLNVSLKNITNKSNTISFDAEIKEDGVLSFATNYSKYFNIFIDGEEVPTKIVNKYFLGCDIEKGSHHIEIIYHNTLILKSFYVSIFGILMFFGIIIIDRKKKAV